MGFLLFFGILFVMATTTIWMAIDAHTQQIPVDKKPYGLNNGALAWFLTGLFLWLITFPYYLWKRSVVLASRQPVSRSVAPIASPHGDGSENGG